MGIKWLLTGDKKSFQKEFSMLRRPDQSDQAFWSRWRLNKSKEDPQEERKWWIDTGAPL